MNEFRFFGYGSLVHRGTHDHAAEPAQLRGWRRAWRATGLRPVSFLTVIPDETAILDGLILTVPQSQLAALDAREAAYGRVDVSALITPARAVSVYAIPDGQHHPPGPDNPVLRSYLEVVVGGYLACFGPTGVARFFDSTDGWQAPILDDRAAPVYPRHQPPCAAVTDLVDLHLARLRQ